MELLSVDNFIISGNSDIQKRLRLMYTESFSFYSTLLCQDSTDVKSGLTHINQCFNCSDRYEGLRFLAVLVSQTSTEIILNNFRDWLHHIRNFILNDDELNVRLTAAKVLTKIISCCHADADHSRYLAQTFMPNIIPQLLSLDNKWLKVVVQVLNSCLTYYSGACRSFLSGIQTKLLHALTSQEPAIGELTALCISRIPFVRASNEHGSTPASAWSELFKKLLQTLHGYLNSIYKNFEIEEHPHIDLSEQIFPKLDAGNETKAFVDSHYRFISICLCLEKMLKNGDTVALPIPVEKTMMLIGRILRVTGKSLSHNESSNQLKLLTILPMIHSAALKLLETLIICGRQKLKIHNRRVLNLLVHSLNWPSTVWKADRNAVSKLRCLAYNVLITWYKVMGSSTRISGESDSLLKLIISDSFQGLNFSEDEKRNGSKCATPMMKRRKVEQYLISTSESNKCEVNEELCCIALKCLKIIIYNNLDEIKPSAFKDLLTKVIHTLQERNSGHLKDVQILNANCRKALYKLLLAMIYAKAYITHQILSNCIIIIKNGCKDGDVDVAQFCLQAITHCHVFLEPVRRYLPINASAFPAENGNQIGQNVTEEENSIVIESDDVSKVVDCHLIDTAPNKEMEADKDANCAVENNIIEMEDMDVNEGLSHQQEPEEKLFVKENDEPSNIPSIDEIETVVISEEDEIEHDNIKEFRDVVELTEDKENISDNEIICLSQSPNTTFSAKSTVLSDITVEHDDETKQMLNSFVLSEPDKPDI